MKITRDVLESYLNCKYKAHLKLKGEHATRSDYETLISAARIAHRERVIERLVSRQESGEVRRGVEITLAVLRNGIPVILDATADHGSLSIKLDGLRRVQGPSRLGDFHYIPILFVAGEKIHLEQRRLLEICGLIIGDVQGKQPEYGCVIRGREFISSKVRFMPSTRPARKTLEEAMKLLGADSPPALILNDHCEVCEFRQRCRHQAMTEDNLSLLRGIGEKELKSYARKGILTITQLAHTFRPRRKGKRAERRNNRRYHALNALAVRDNRIYVFGSPEIPTEPLTIFLDIEGLPDEGFVYLIGMLVVRAGLEQRYSFWADSHEQECRMFDQFLDEIEAFDEFIVFTYGSYEKAFLGRMRKRTDRPNLVDRVLNSMTNILSVVYSQVYFPTYSNSLKEVGRCLGFSWSESDATGLQSIAWRMRWESTLDEGWKLKLTTYNLEDCLALKRVTDFVRAVSAWNQAGAEKPSTRTDGPQVALVHEIDSLANISNWGSTRFVHPEFNFINDCAYFDYQRQRVFVRTSNTLRRRLRSPKGTRHNRLLRKTRSYVIVHTQCPSCNSSDVVVASSHATSGFKRPRVKMAFDLVVTPAGVRRKVIECRSPVQLRRHCGHRFISAAHQNIDKHFRNLKSWAIYLHVAHQLSFKTVSVLLREMFNLQVADTEIVAFKSLLARTYQPTYRKLLEKILGGHVLHADETEVKLKTVKANVWVFASLEEVVYMYRPNREGGFHEDLLKDFHGVLVSDFYAAYDSLECPQQKCLIHLIRDVNQDLLNNPFDEELRSITQSFGELLQAIVSTVDKHGLKTAHLKRHRRRVAEFFRMLTDRSFSSEVAEGLRDRFLKYRQKLFTFMEYDAVPWNNNCAENAIKRFAYYREGTVGTLTEAGLSDYLVLLSIFQTCRYKGASFLKFLLSRESDIDVFCKSRRIKVRPPLIEVYPDGFVPPHFAYKRKPRVCDDSPVVPLVGSHQ
jgi:predicted RecB family nuclease